MSSTIAFTPANPPRFSSLLSEILQVLHWCQRYSSAQEFVSKGLPASNGTGRKRRSWYQLKKMLWLPFLISVSGWSTAEFGYSYRLGEVFSGLVPMQTGESNNPFLAEGLQYTTRSTYPFSGLSHFLRCTLLLEVLLHQQNCILIHGGISLRAVLCGMTLLLVYRCSSPSDFPILSPTKTWG